MSQFGLAKNGLKILGTKCCSLDGPKIGWEQLSHCDSWSKILGYKCSFFGWTNSSSTLGFGLGPTVTRTKQTAVQLSLGLTVWVELSLGLNVSGLNVKAPKIRKVGIRNFSPHLCNSEILRTTKSIAELRTKKSCGTAIVALNPLVTNGYYSTRQF
jgi:hypothetical protein